MYADIIVDITLEKLNHTFQYAVPEEMEDRVAIGLLVTIPFGNRKTNGVIIGLYTNSSGWLPVQLIESQNDEGRFYFEGVSVTDKSVLERYINRIVEIPKGARYPILYVGGWK